MGSMASFWLVVLQSIRITSGQGVDWNPGGMAARSELKIIALKTVHIRAMLRVQLLRAACKTGSNALVESQRGDKVNQRKDDDRV